MTGIEKPNFFTLNPQMRLHWLQERLTNPGGPPHTIEADLALSLLYVSKGLFYPVLDCAVFSLETPIPNAVGRNA